MTAVYPVAIFKPLPEAKTQTKITPRLIILHTNGGGSSTNGAQLWAYMNQTTVTLECHFQIDLDGTVWQFMPVDVRADCNAAANPFAVSIETQDKGSATLNDTPWADPQVQSIVEVIAWLRDDYGILMARCLDWNGAGIGAHRDFPQWSNSAHSCPGNARFAQVPDIIEQAKNYNATNPPTDIPPVVVPPVMTLPPVTPNPPAGWVPLYSKEGGVAALHRIVHPRFATEVVRWDSGALGWANHAENVPTEVIETDDEAFKAIMGSATVPPVPPSQQVLTK